MHFGLSAEQGAFLRELREYLDGWEEEGFTPTPLLRELDHYHEMTDLREEMMDRFARDGWLTARWPAEYGGSGRGDIEGWLVFEEQGYRRLPYANLGVGLVGQCIRRYGTEEQKQRLLPPILERRIEFALGYSEPNAGSDLASLQTRAVRDGDEYVINGQKIWCSYAERTTHVWLATRTGPADSRHRGISMFVVDLQSPGITIRPIHTQGGFYTTEVFFDDVRVPAADRVGEENQGWAVIMLALDLERTTNYGTIAREFEEIVQWAIDTERDGAPVSEDPLARRTIAELSADMEAARLLSMRPSWMLEAGVVPNAEASVNKVFNSDLRLRVADLGLGLMGEDGQLALGEERAPNLGRTELTYRVASLFRFAAGANEVQRNIIAQRGLGMQRG
jgi:alkylation response protein AidB-like acyl-CoA dehydrogenase